MGFVPMKEPPNPLHPQTSYGSLAIVLMHFFNFNPYTYKQLFQNFYSINVNKIELLFVYLIERLCYKSTI